MRNHAARGFTLLLVLMLLMVLGAVAGSVCIVLRPAASNLDAHIQLGRAQALADGALQEALARLDAGQPGTVSHNGAQTGEAWAVEESGSGSKRELAAAGRLQVPAPGGAPRQAVARIRAEVILKEQGRWAVARCMIDPAVFETGK